MRPDAAALLQLPESDIRLLAALHFVLSDEVDELRSIVVELMGSAFPMIVPLGVEARTGPNWQDLS